MPRAPEPNTEEFVQSAHAIRFPLVIDRARQWRGQDGSGGALALLFREACERLLTDEMGPPAQDSRVREGPWEGRLADLGARAAVPRAVNPMAATAKGG